MYQQILDDYESGSLVDVFNWHRLCRRLIFKKTLPKYKWVTLDPFEEELDDMTRCLLMDIYIIEDVRPILIGKIECEGVKTSAIISTFDKEHPQMDEQIYRREIGEPFLMMPYKTMVRCSMAMSLCGLLQLLYPKQSSDFRNLESQIIGWEHDGLTNEQRENKRNADRDKRLAEFMDGEEKSKVQGPSVSRRA